MQTCHVTIRVYVVRPLCPSIPNIKSNVGRKANHLTIAFSNFRWPLLCSFIFGSHLFPDSNISLQEPLPGYYVLYGSRRRKSRDQ